MDNGESNLDKFKVKDLIKKQKKRIEELLTPQEKKKRKELPQRFKKGNKLGVKFGSGQSIAGNGRPRKTDSTPLQEMKAAAETYGLAANEIAEAMVNLGLDETIEARFRFLFMKEANLRIFGQPKNSLEDTLKHINDKVDKLYELTMPLLEATAIGDGIGLVRELMSQGRLDEVIKKIEGEN